MKLSESRRKILERMSGGDEIWTLSGINPSAFWHHSASDRSPRLDTDALCNAGLIERYEREWRGSKYRISTAGHAAMAEVNQQTGKP